MVGDDASSIFLCMHRRNLEGFENMVGVFRGFRVFTDLDIAMESFWDSSDLAIKGVSGCGSGWRFLCFVYLRPGF